ncbi:hypothetical protein AB0950_39375 [Streptomyces sp. NPDC007189]|uniref:hypothetical protein n=1 Tax=Streptomyces sp. NPDC007189 TaxID=3154315 RepID=UPI003454FC7C
MAEHGGDAGLSGGIRRSRLSEYVDMAGHESTPAPAPNSPNTPSLPEHSLSFTPAAQAALPDTDAVARRRREFAAALGQFRRRRVLVPYGDSGAALTVELQGVRWLLAFTDEWALARYARARGESDRRWPYRMVWGAAVLDAGVAAVAGAAGLPCGVLVDAGDGERGLVLPPVTGIVPEAVAVDRPHAATELGTEGGRS